MRFERHVVLPQTISITVEGKQLQNALEVNRFPSMKDDRDEPGTVESGRSKLDRTGYYADHEKEPHPTPLFNGVECIRISRGNDGYGFFGPERKDMDVIQATKTAMSPEVAEAFIRSLADDPAHPFVLAHIAKGFNLNGSDSWLTVGGPAFAIPLTRLDPRDARARRAKDYVQPELDGKPLELEVHVNNMRGLRGEDLIAAARRHPDLGPHGISVGAVELLSLEPLAHRADGDVLTGREIPMFKLAHDDRPLGFYATAEEAQAALEEAVGKGDHYRDEGTLFTGNHYALRVRYSVEGCLVLDGKEVRPSFTSELVEAKATVRVRVARLKPGRPAPHVGWMLVWQARDWHRNPEILTQHFNSDGTLISQSRSGWGTD